MNNIVTEGEVLRIEIKKSKITQEDFASRMGFSRGYLVRLMERAELPEDIKQKASKILKIDMKVFSVQSKPHNEEIGESKPQTAIPETHSDMMNLMRETIEALRGENAIQKKYIALLEARMK